MFVERLRFDFGSDMLFMFDVGSVVAWVFFLALAWRSLWMRKAATFRAFLLFVRSVS